MTVPLFVTIQRLSGEWEMIEIVPPAREMKNVLVDTGVYQLYRGLPDTGEIDHFDEESGHYLGDLHFQGFRCFEWKYTGTRLNETEVEHLVDLIQRYDLRD